MKAEAVKYLGKRWPDKRRPERLHILDGSDTWCRMLSTGGMKRRNYVLMEPGPDSEVCSMCDERSRATRRREQLRSAVAGICRPSY